MKKRMLIIVHLGLALISVFVLLSYSNHFVYDSSNSFFSSHLPAVLKCSKKIQLPDLYEFGKGFSCTGLAYDNLTDSFLVGDIGSLEPNHEYKSQIVRLSPDFQTVIETIPLYLTISNLEDIQGICIDTSDETIWFCSPNSNKVYHISMNGYYLDEIEMLSPTGITYSSYDDSFWILTYQKADNICHLTKDRTITEKYTFEYSGTLDQCYFNNDLKIIYITAGTNYSSDNNVYFFDTNTNKQGIAFTIDSYSVEGIWLDEKQMIIANDGYYHNAYDNRNIINIYNLPDS